MEDRRYKNLAVSIDGRVALLVVSRPQVLNALNEETLDELESAFASFSQDSGIGAVIVAGAGDRAFVAGGDIRELMQLDAVTGAARSARGQAVFARIESCPKPVIAAIQGYCLGGGCELALACHLRIAAKGARLGQPEVRLGLIPGYGGTQRLSRLIGLGRALELILVGEMIEAEEAERIGLVNRVVLPEELIPYCRKLAVSLLGNAPLAVQYALKAILQGRNMPVGEALALESGLFGLCCSTWDMKEGTQAFLEKRKPQFQSR